MSRSVRSIAIRIVAVLAVSLVFSACKSDEEKIGEFLELGNGYVENEQYEEAVIQFRNVLKLDPNNAEAHYELAKSYLVLNKGRDAYWELTETVRIDPTNIEARLSLGAISLMARDYEQTLTQAEAAIEAQPDDPKGYVLAGKALAAQGRFDEAEERYLKAVELEESRVNLLVLASFYSQQERRDDAEPWFWKSAEVGNDFRAHTALGKFLIQDRAREDEAEKAFKDALATAEEDHILEAYQNLAAFYIAMERGEEGVAVLQEGISKSGDDNRLTYMLARYHRGSGNEEQAEVLLRKAAENAQDDPETFLVLSAYLGQKGDLEGALAAADDALKVAPENVNARLRKAEILIDLGFRERAKEREEGLDVEAAGPNPRVEEGLALVDAVLAEVPSLADAHFVRGKALLALGKTDEGIDALRAAADGRPNWAEAHFVLGSALATIDDASGARIELARAIELDASLIEARRLLAAIHQTLGEHEYAIDQGRKYLKERPDHIATRVLVAQSLVRIGKRKAAMRELEMIPPESRDASVYFAIGRMALARGETEEAIALLEQANELAPNNAKVLRSLFQAERSIGRLEDSKVRIQKAIEDSPDDPEIVRLLGMVAFIEQDMQGAEDAFTRAVELDPDNAEAHQQLARFYQLTGRTDETIATYKKALEASPDNSSMHQFLAMLYESQGETDLAIASYEEAIKYDSRNGQAKNNLAYLLAEEGRDLDRALDLAQDAKALLPDSANAADTLGWVLYKRGVASAAVGYLREALNGSEPDAATLGIIRYHLALAYDADNQRDNAVKMLEQNLEELDEAARAAQAKGRTIGSPPWEKDARAMLERLKTTG